MRKKTNLTPKEYRKKWGIPDWRNAQSYPRKLSDQLWRWEFLRRREDYRDDWELHSSRNKEWYGKHSLEEYFLKQLKGPSGDGRVADNWETDPKSQGFFVLMPNCLEKYGMENLCNPAIPRPEHLILSGPRLLPPGGAIKSPAGALSIHPHYSLEAHVRTLKVALKLYRRIPDFRPPREHRELWSTYLRALDAEAEKVPDSEICRILDPHSKRGHKRGYDLIDQAHKLQDMITRPLIIRSKPKA